MRAVSFIVIAPWLAACHLASGIDDIKIDRRTAEVQKEQFACAPDKDELDAIDADRFSIDDADAGIDVAYDDALDGVTVTMTDALTGVRGGVITIDKFNFDDCYVIVEVDPPTEASAFAMVALLESPDDEVPLVAMRKEGSELITSRTDDDLQSIDFNADQRFWRIIQSGEQILFQHSENGDGAWMPVGAVAKPDQARAVHVGLLAGASAPILADAATFLFYGLKTDP